MKNVQTGEYLRLSIREDRLRIYLTRAGRFRLSEIREANKEYARSGQDKFITSDLEAFTDLMSDLMSNGWTEVKPEAVGDLRDSDWLVISKDYVDADANGRTGELLVGTAYGYTQYAVESYTGPLVRRGYIDFEKHVYMDERTLQAAVAEFRPDLFTDETERQDILTRYAQVELFRQAERGGQLPLPLAA